MIKGIYKITSPTGKVYIGQSIDIEKRFRIYKRVKPCFAQKTLYQSLMKHGVGAHSFDVLHQLPNDVDDDILNVYEILYIAQHKSCGIKMLNMSNGGRGRACSVSEETKKKISQAHKGKVVSEESRIRMSNAQKGGKRSEAHKAALSWKGRKHKEETKRKIGAKSKLRSGELNCNYGKKRSEETKQKQSEALKGKYVGEKAANFGTKHKPESLQKMQQTHLKKWSDPEYKAKMRQAAIDRWKRQKEK
jgi:group I intron endonuclease